MAVDPFRAKYNTSIFLFWHCLKETWPPFSWLALFLRIGSETELCKESWFSNKIVDIGLCSPALDLLCLYRLRTTIIGCPSILPPGTGWSISQCHRFPMVKDPWLLLWSCCLLQNYIHVTSNYWVLKRGLCSSEIISFILILESPMEVAWSYGTTFYYHSWPTENSLFEFLSDASVKEVSCSPSWEYNQLADSLVSYNSSTLIFLLLWNYWPFLQYSSGAVWCSGSKALFDNELDQLLKKFWWINVSTSKLKCCW